MADRYLAGLAQLGPAYLADPALAPQLLEALIRCDDDGVPAETLINQAWLDCHWNSAEAVSMLMDINDFWDRGPEPLCRFMEACWARERPAWHHFIDIEDMEDNADFAAQVYARFSVEGPTDDVLSSMMYLSRSLDCDRYAVPIMPDMINRGMRDNPTKNLLKLWRRYMVTDGIDDGAVRAIAVLLADDDLANNAVRVVECMRMRHIKPMLGAITALAGRPTGQAARRASRILVGLSDTPCAPDLARVICQYPMRPYVQRLGHRTLLQPAMQAYAKAHRAIDLLIDLWNVLPGATIISGGFTTVLEMEPTWFELGKMESRPDYVPPDSAHGAIYHMHVRGTPPRHGYWNFQKTFHYFPEAVEVIAKRAPRVSREVKWARRGPLLASMASYNKMRSRRTQPCEVLSRLAHCECCWPVVFQYL